eukprot:9363827-Ditylum_brightwellii.AAC.1
MEHPMPNGIINAKFSPKLGKDDLASTLVKNICPVGPIREKFINDYKKAQATFWVKKSCSEEI